MTADPHTLHCAPEQSLPGHRAPCAWAQNNTKSLYGTVNEKTSIIQSTSSVYKEMALEINVHWTEEEGASIVQTCPLLQL